MNNKNKQFNIAVVGLGTIGYGVCDIVNQCENLNLYAVSDLDETRIKKVQELKNDIIAYHDFNELLKDDKVNLVVEVIGGVKIAEKIIKGCLNKHIPVVTANKEIVALKYDELMDLANKTNTPFYFEASVGGTIPIINSIYHYSLSDKITLIEGIINGSTNYVLTRVQNDGMKYLGAIEEAKKLGYLEQDPSADLEGKDMMRKIVILSNIAYQTKLNIEDVYTYPLSRVNEEYFNYLKSNNLKLKYMSYSALTKDGVNIFIEPVVVESNSLLASVNYANNYIAFMGKFCNYISFTGMGAGRYPTAQAIVSDINMIKKNNNVLDLTIKNDYQINNNTMDKNLFLIQYNNNIFKQEELTRKELIEKLNQITFYARIKLCMN